MEESKLVVTVEQNRQMNAFGKFFGMIYSPVATLQALVCKPSILLPVLMMVLVPVAFFLTNFDAYGNYMRETLEMAAAKNNSPLTPEQLTAQVKMASVIGLAGAPIGVIVGWLIGTLLLFGIVKIFKGHGQFKDYLSVTANSFAVTMLYYIVLGIITFLTGTMDMEAPASSLAAFFPADMKGNVFFGLLKGVEFFTLWYYIVMGTGVFFVSKLEKSKVYIITGINYLLFLAYCGIGELMAKMFAN